MAIRIFDQTVGQTAGISVVTTGKGPITNDGLEAYAQMTVSASGQPISSTAGVGNLVALTGATVTAGSLSLSANSQSAVIDTQGFEGLALTVSGFGTATVEVQWSNLAASGFVAGSVTNINSLATATSITANGQYTASSGGRYAKITTTAFTSGPIVVTPVLLAGSSVGGGGGGGGGAVTIADGADVTQGAEADAAWVSGNATLVALGKATVNALNTPASYLPLPGAAASGDTTLTQLTPAAIVTATTTSLVGATASQFTRVYRLVLTCVAANTIVFKSATTAITQVFTFPTAGGTLTLDFSGYWWFTTAVNAALQITTTTTASVTMDLYYIKSV